MTDARNSDGGPGGDGGDGRSDPDKTPPDGFRFPLSPDERETFRELADTCGAVETILRRMAQGGGGVASRNAAVMRCRRLRDRFDEFARVLEETGE